MTKRHPIFICFVLTLLTVITLIGWGMHAVWGFGSSRSPRVVGRAVAPDGTELCVIQEANHLLLEPFTTSVVFRKPGGKWGWFYYDHEDTYWEHAETELCPVAKSILVLRDGVRAVTFDWETEIYWKWDGQRITRTFTNAQSWLPDSWTVTNSIRGLL